MYKSLEYAYPTSPTADKNGLRSVGCWFIRVYESATSWKPIEEFGHTQFKAALLGEYDSLAYEPHKFTLA